jgi:hypothetical protein
MHERTTAFKTSNPKEEAVGEQQCETRPTRNEGCALLILEAEALGSA